jgi:hypothetical protein
LAYAAEINFTTCDLCLRNPNAIALNAGEYPSLQRTFSFIVKKNPSLSSLHLTNLAIMRLRMQIGQPAQATRDQKPSTRPQSGPETPSCSLGTPTTGSTTALRRA